MHYGARSERELTLHKTLAVGVFAAETVLNSDHRAYDRAGATSHTTSILLLPTAMQVVHAKAFPVEEAAPPPYSEHAQAPRPVGQPTAPPYHAVALPYNSHTQPSHQMQAPASSMAQNNSPGVLKIIFLPPDMCTDCWACCACCWVLPQPQPSSSHKYEVIVKDKSHGTLKQGQSLSFQLPPGMHTVGLQKTGVRGFFASITGTALETTAAVSILPGATTAYKIGYIVPKCQGSKKYLFLEPDE